MWHSRFLFNQSHRLPIQWQLKATFSSMERLGFTNCRLGVRASHVMELDSIIVEVVEDCETVFRSSSSVWLGTSASSETPWVLSLPDPLGPAVLPGESPLVRADPAPGPEVGRPISSHLAHEVFRLVPRVKRDYPHPSLGTVGPGCRVAEAVPAFSPGEQVVASSPLVVASTRLGLSRL